MIQVVAKDLDEEDSYNSDLRYSILSQEPTLPSNNLFVINPVTGFIRVNAGGLDREVRTHHTLNAFVSCRDRCFKLSSKFYI